ncbi:dephospho-CoA kinase [Antricoccus suffuscus]|uniref:Dephospho-CoA kinase n=1 Tax=Antricoccus suffuscus TaxID=1629062 RepID=A0A2T0ZW65_9ACTN|nr:dephospho-CoA kinase [Antricoccus suffuscus]PRZ40592.1 dephospho-CoA kinase [Antricoccus suffuscus]
MLDIGLTGGIGSGKSAASTAFRELGAVIIDADQIAREVVEPGSDGLEQIVRTFGADLLDPQGALDRPALAEIVFGDDEARAKLNAIVHPLVRQRSSALKQQAAPDAIVINDIPLLAEGSMAAAFHLVVVVHTPRDVRLKRLIESRGMVESDVRGRMASQASDADRSRIADALLDNSGTPQDLVAAATALWRDRLKPYADNLAAARPAAHASETVLDESARQRALARVTFAAAAVDDAATTTYLDETTIGVRPSDPGNKTSLVRRFGEAGWFTGDPDSTAPLRSSDPRVPLDLHIGDPSAR